MTTAEERGSCFCESGAASGIELSVIPDRVTFVSLVGQWGGNLTNFSSNFEPSIACLRIAHIIFLGEKFGMKKVGQQIWEICLLRDLPAEFSTKKNYMSDF